MTLETDILPPRYRGVRRIGRGGMGEIYRATDDMLGRAVAIKLLAEAYAADEDVRQRFTREALAAARLSGEPNTVTIFDVGDWNERPFIVMEYLSGGSLEERVREGPQEPGRVLAWLEQAGRALDGAHANGVVHRDVKPANLLLNRAGDVQVADFGIASAAGLADLTKPGTVLGTAGYLSPEQARGERAGPASDRYALAIVAWELLTGSRPFAADSMTAEAAAHVSAPVPRISQRSGSLPRELDDVFGRALAKEPAERYESCAELVSALRMAFEESAGTTRSIPPAGTVATRRLEERPPGDAPRPSRRRPLAIPLALTALIAAALAGVGLAAMLGGEEDPETTRTLVRTVTRAGPGTTVENEVTVTAPAPPAPPSPPAEQPPPPPPAENEDGKEEREEQEPEPPPPPPPPPPAATAGTINEAVELTDESTALMRAGDYEGALALARQALTVLNGTGQVYEGYANFNAGNSLARLGRCREAIPHLRKRQRFGQHPDVDAALRRCGAG